MHGGSSGAADYRPFSFLWASSEATRVGIYIIKKHLIFIKYLLNYMSHVATTSCLSRRTAADLVPEL